MWARQVAYREKITRRTEIDYTHKKQTGGSGQFARVKFVVEKGLESVLGSGVLAGFPVVDLKVQLVDGAYHEAGSSALAFEIGSRTALRDGLQKGHSVLLE